jgi:hypothetical protein
VVVEHKDQQVLQVLLEQPEHKVQMDHKVLQVLEEILVVVVQQDLKVLLVLLVIPEQLVPQVL